MAKSKVVLDKDAVSEAGADDMPVTQIDEPVSEDEGQEAPTPAPAEETTAEAATDSGRAVVFVDAARLAKGGDIAEAYSADSLMKKNNPLKKPFSWGGNLYTVTGKLEGSFATVYLIIPEADWPGEVSAAPNWERENAYSGMRGMWNKQIYILAGAALEFHPAPDAESITPETMAVPVAAPEPEAEPDTLPDDEANALVAWFGDGEIKRKGKLSDEEVRDRENLEEVVKDGLLHFIQVGRAIKEIHDRKLWRSTHLNFRAYVQETFNLKSSQAYRTMRAAEAAETIAGAEAIIDGEVVQAAVPSIKAADEFYGISELVDTTNLSAAEVLAFTKDLEEFALQLAIEVAPKVNGKAQLSAKVFAGVKEVLLEAATLTAVEIEGEHHEVSAAHIAVNRHVFENMMREKQKWVDEIKTRQERLSAPQVASKERDESATAGEARTVEMKCSAHGKADLRDFKIMFGGFVLSCGCKFRRIEGEDMPTYQGNETGQ